MNKKQRKIYNNKYYKEHKQKRKIYDDKKYLLNKEYILKQQRERYRKCKKLRIKKRKKVREYESKNKLKVKKYRQKYYKINRDRILENTKVHNKKYRKRNKLKIKQYWKEYHFKNREKEHQRKKKYKRELFIVEYIDKQKLLKDFSYKCPYCGKKLKNDNKTHIDHLIPVIRYAKLGKKCPHGYNNCVPCCSSCNTRKHDKTPLEFYWKM